jgi:hypothetical protein
MLQDGQVMLAGDSVGDQSAGERVVADIGKFAGRVGQTVLRSVRGMQRGHDGSALSCDHEVPGDGCVEAGLGAELAQDSLGVGEDAALRLVGDPVD